MKRLRLALATDRDYPDLYSDDRLLIAPLAALGIDAAPAIWNSADTAWETFDGVLVRSTWNYYTQSEAFAAWIDRLHSRGIPMWNAPSVLKWNLDKRYLREIESLGVPVVPTRWLRFTSRDQLLEAFEAAGWDEAVLKPTVSAGAWLTSRLSRHSPPPANAFDGISPNLPLMLQPFLKSIHEEGEWSLLFFGGEFCHAVLKAPAAGDFRIQLQYGGTIATPPPPPLAVALARELLDKLRLETVYARVDLVRDGKKFLLMELELIEPLLYLEFDPAAPRRFAEAIRAALYARSVP